MCDHCSCRSFEPIADLSREHEVILGHAWAVAEGQDPGGRRATALVAMLEDHVHKEEAGLYPWLVRTGDLAADTLDRLEAEHRDVHAEIAEGRFGRVQFYALAAHIEEEELELFPAAMFAFDDDAWADLDRLVGDLHRVTVLEH